MTPRKPPPPPPSTTAKHEAISESVSHLRFLESPVATTTTTTSQRAEDGESEKEPVTTRFASPSSSRLNAVLSSLERAISPVRDEVLVAAIDLSHAVSHLLRDAGFVVSFAKSEADVDMFVNERIPVAILLGPLEGSDPYTALRMLRRDERLAFVQIFVFAPKLTKDTFRAADALKSGADDVFILLDDHTALQNKAAATDVASRIVARIDRSRHLTQLAMLDPLTGLHNRRFMTDRLRAELAMALRTTTQTAVAIVDLDHFKTVNDTFGHAVGDRVLRQFAHALGSELRAYDVVCRWGGDEFVVLFPKCDAKGAHQALANLRASQSWNRPDAPTITFSAGIAEFPGSAVEWVDLLEMADRNLRRAKQEGRGRSI